MEGKVDAAQVEEVINVAKSLNPTEIIVALAILVIGIILSKLAVKVIDKVLKKYKVVPAVTTMLMTIIRFILYMIVTSQIKSL